MLFRSCLEVGGHGLSELLPRDLFEDHPEYFRMFQPEDFNGRRMPDSNLCVTNPDARTIVQENYRKRLESIEGVYALHAWADDLPAGGWCLCPSCRAFPPADQATLAMRMLAEVARDAGVRVPVLAYHDTMFPGSQVPPAPECFLLFAPRERCYGHALDDPSCPRNRFYMEALRQWMAAFEGIDDAHTFEYYFDQILFRGVYPYLPEVILRDMRVYESHGIESHLSLQVGGPNIAPEFNQLLFARAAWDPGLTADGFARDLAGRMNPARPEPIAQYLATRGDLFADAMRMCEYDTSIYFDYRWLPENTQPFGPEMAQTYAHSADRLDRAAASLAHALSGDVTGNVRTWVGREQARVRFEAAELRVMASQQRAMNALGRYQVGRSPTDLNEGLAALTDTLDRLAPARELAEAAGLPEKSWYYKNINGWLRGELTRKSDAYRKDAEG